MKYEILPCIEENFKKKKWEKEEAQYRQWEKHAMRKRERIKQKKERMYAVLSLLLMILGFYILSLLPPDY